MVISVLWMTIQNLAFQVSGMSFGRKMERHSTGTGSIGPSWDICVLRCAGTVTTDGKVNQRMLHVGAKPDRAKEGSR